MKKTELAWAAGFFDGEGHFGCHHFPYLYLSISQKDRNVLDRFRRIFKTGRVYPPYGKDSCYRFAIGNFHSIQKIIVALWPYLSIVKRDQVLHIIRTV